MAAQDAELKLKVSLDLAFFRQQLAGLGAATAGTPLELQVQFDRRSVQKELNALGANIRRRNYTLNVNTNLKAEIENASKLAKALDDLGRSRKAAQGSINQQLGLGVLLKGPQGGGLGSKDVTKLYRAAAQAGLLEYNKEIARTKAATVAALEEVGADSVRGLLNGLSSEDKKLRAAATYLGESLIKTVKGVLGIASPSREFKKIGQNVGEGFQQGVMSSMDKAFDAVEGLMRARMKVLDTIARGMFRMAGIDPLALRAEAAQRRALPGVNFPATVPPRSVSIGPSSTGRALPAGASTAGLITGAKPLAGLLPEMSVRSQIKAIVDALIAQQPSGDTGVSGGLVSLESGFINQIRSRFARVAKGFIFGIETQVIDLFDSTQQAVNTAVDRYIASIQSKLLQDARRGVSVRDLGSAVQKALPPAPSAPARLMLPAAGGTTPPGQMRFNAVRTGAVLGQQQFMRAPSIPAAIGGGGGMQPPGGGGGFGGFGGMGGFGGFGRTLGNVPNLPGTGTIRELGSEFAFATKQVLLFGQAYKLLGFAQSFPAQVGAAISSLQSFKNTLNAISPTAEEARLSNELILGLVEKYNIPLESARQGFTKLYASMEPAGFSGEEISNLFTGISKASATLGLSSDKVDRVTYAFSQMASKGQLMSEEVSGQLGDVIPGALSIMAEAADMGLAEFKKAMEDGEFVGKRFTEVMNNVPKVLEERFGKGAEGAAKTFQGAINNMQTSLKLFYESFEPIAVGFLNTVVAPMTDGIKQLSDGLNAFFTGATAKTAGGGVFASQLTQLKPAFDGIRQNLQQLTPLFASFTEIAISLGKVLLQVAGNPFVGYLLQVYAAVLPLTAAIKILNLQAIIPMIASLVRAIPAFIAFNAAKLRLISTNKALQVAMQLTGSTSAVTAGKIRLVTAALATLAAPVILLGIGALVERFMMLKGAVDGVRQSTQQMLQSISSMANTGAVKDLRNVAATTRQQISTFEGLSPFVSGGAVGPQRKLTSQAAAKMQELGLGSFVSKDVLGKPYINDFVNASKIIEERLKGLRKQAASVQEKLPLAEKVAADLAKQAQQAQTVQPIPPGEGDGAGKGKTKRERQLRDFENEAIAQLQLNQRLAQERLDQQRQLELIDETEYDIASASNKRKFELLIIEEALADKRANIGDYEAGIRQKQLAVFEQLAANERQLVEEEYKTAIKGAKLKISRPLTEGIKNENIEIEKQAILLRRLQSGYSELTPEQEANLIVEEKIKDLRTRQQDLVKTEIENLRQVTLERIRGAQALARETEFLKLRNQAAQLRAPLGRERLVELMQTPGYTPEQANQQFNLEEQNKRLQVMRQGASDLAGTINSSIGDALTNIATDFQNLQQHGMTFLQTLANGFKQLANTIIQEMTRAIINKAVSQLFSFIMPSIGNAGGGGGADLTAGIRQYGYANGGIAPGGFRAFASGGVVTGPTLGLVGEGRYNEAVVPLPDGKSIPVQLGGGAGGDISTNIVVNVSNGQASSQMSGNGGQALGRELEGAVRQVILKETRPGGLIYSAR